MFPTGKNLKKTTSSGRSLRGRGGGALGRDWRGRARSYGDWRTERRGCKREEATSRFTLCESSTATYIDDGFVVVSCCLVGMSCSRPPHRLLRRGKAEGVQSEEFGHVHAGVEARGARLYLGSQHRTVVKIHIVHIGE